MRLTSFGIILALLTVFVLHSTAGRTDAQIPERTLFQPGSYAYGMYRAPTQPAVQSGFARTKTVLVEVEEEIVANDDDKSDWEKDFGVAESTAVIQKKLVEMQVPDLEPAPAPAATTSPYLAYYRHPITHRVHVVPYQKGYPEGSEDMPKHQTKLNLWLSSLPCREQNRPQVQYLGYYDPDPEIIEDRPSRIDLILGYPNAQWTTCCDNRWGHRMAQCPGIEQFGNGPAAEGAIRDQACDPYAPQGLFGGIFAGVHPINYDPMGPAQPRVYGLRRSSASGAAPCNCSYCRQMRQQATGQSHAATPCDCPYCTQMRQQAVGQSHDAAPCDCPYCTQMRQQGDLGPAPQLLKAQTLPAKTADMSSNCPKRNECIEKKPCPTTRCGNASCKSCAKKTATKVETGKTKPAVAPPKDKYPLKSPKKIETEEIAAKSADE